MSDDVPEVDPRYDRAFQRGFDGEVETAPREQSALRRTVAVTPAPSRAVPQREAPTAIEAPPIERDESRVSSSFAPEGTPSIAAATTDATTAAPVAVGPRELARNPFLIGLAALGAVLIVAGAIWAYEGFATIIRNGGTRNEVEFWAAQTMSFGAPLAIGLGLAVAAVLLVLFGRAWQRTRP